MEDNFIKASLGILNNNGPLDIINQTLLALIPKVKDPNNLTQYRPISLCTIVYKVIYKTIVNHLKDILPNLISDKQSAFVPGRQIVDNIMVAFEAMHMIGNKCSGKDYFIALKLDMSKAYDRVKWYFLRQMMLEMGFASIWVDLIMRCVSIVFYSILNNGVSYGRIILERGLRQGDPLSPYLFLICAEGLSSLLKKAGFMGVLTGLKIAPTSPTISHIFLQMTVYYLLIQLLKIVKTFWIC